jgi:uncharacterized membrane protein YdjX (TVP38/TMEM64 family)
VLAVLILLAVAGLVLAGTGGLRSLLAGAAAYEAWLDRFIAQHLLVALSAYVLLYTGLMTLMWLPAWPCTVIGGFLFGRGLGFAGALLGATGGATAVFLLARVGLGAFVGRAGPAGLRLAAAFGREAFSLVLAARLVPVIPFALVNLGAALLNVRLRDFVSATLLGIVPSTLIYASLGAGLDDLTAADPGSVLLRPNILLPLIGLALLALLPAGYRWARARGSG